MEEQEKASAGASGSTEQHRAGVRYITEELLLKLTASRSLALVRSLDLSPAPGDKRIKFIENLHGCQRLQVLNLNHNAIERMERLAALTQLRDLQLAHNNIRRIEGLEHLSRLQRLDLSYNRIQHVPVWLGKKLHSLHTLHLQHNLVTSLYEVSRLRSLSSLSELSVSGNPASSPPHSRLFLLYHLRTLDRLDDLPVSPKEREAARQRFNIEELEHLQREVDSCQSELSKLRGEHQAAVSRLHQQGETNQTLVSQTQMQRHSHALLEQELHTKSQLPRPPVFLLGVVYQLEKTTAELTRSFHKMYELEQELAFYKIDAKLSPLPPRSIQDVVTEDSVVESPYVGKARYIRKTCTSSPAPSSIKEDVDIHPDVEEDHKTRQSAVEAESLQLAHEAEHFSAKEPETHAQDVRSRLLSKLLRDEADEAQRQTDGQTEETETQAPVSTQLSSCRQMLDRMSRKQSELEGRLDDMLSRIARETQEISELEQQLTDGQILANEALQRELEEIISGLQEYLRGLRDQARCAQQQVYSLQAENQSLQLQLEETQRHCRQLEDTSRTHRQNMHIQQEELSVLQALRDRQAESSRQQVDMEAELRQLRAELTRQVTVGQLQRDALQTAADKEKRTQEIRECQLQSTVDKLQDEKSSLQQIVQSLQTQLDQTRAQNNKTTSHLGQTRIQLDQFTKDLLALPAVQSGPEELDEDKHSPVSSEHLLSTSVEHVYEVSQKTRTSREQFEQDHNFSRERMARVRAQFAHHQDHTDQLKAQVDQTQVTQDHEARNVEQDQESDWRLEEELERLRGKLQRTRSRNRCIQQNLESQLEQRCLQLQDVQQERDKLLQQLHSQGEGHQRSLGRLNRKLRQLSRSVCDSDQLTAEQLNSTVEQLRALNRTMDLLHTQKPVDEIDGSSHQAEHTHVLQDQHTVEELREQLVEAQKLAHRLRQKLDRVRTKGQTKTDISKGDGGQWCFVPPGPTVPSFGSEGTQDSGLGLQYLSSPDRGRQHRRPPTGGGYWVYIPPTHTGSDTAAVGGRVSGGDGNTDGSSGGGTPPPPDPATGVSAGLPDEHEHLVGPPWLLCGAVLHCNVPEHRGRGETSVCEHEEAGKLEEEKKKLRQERKRLRRALGRHRSVMLVCDEVECVEETLLKRRAELRQADKLLLEAQSCIHTTRDKASSAQWTASVLHLRAQVSATCLQETALQLRCLRDLQKEEEEDFRQRRQQEQQGSRGQELQLLGSKVHWATNRLSALLSDCQEAQKLLDSVSSQVARQEQRLRQRNQEHHAAVSRVEELREEETRLHSTVKELLRDRTSAATAVREEQQKLLTLQSEADAHRAELKRVLQELLVEQQALEDVKTKHTQTLQQLHKKKDELDRTADELDTAVKKLKRKPDKVNRKQEELTVLQQQVEPGLRSLDQQRAELQELQEELRRRREEKSSLQEQCRQLEARRRHADRCLMAVEAELAKRREEHDRVQVLTRETLRDPSAALEQLDGSSELLSLLTDQGEERPEQPQTLEQEPNVSQQQELERQVELKQDVKAAVCQLDDRRRCLTEQQLQLGEELLHKEELKRQREEHLHLNRNHLHAKEEELQKKRKKLQEGQEIKEDSRVASTDESVCLTTAGLRTAFSAEEMWEVELQKEELKQHEDRLKQETLTVRRLETEERLLALKVRLQQLDVPRETTRPGFTPGLQDQDLLLPSCETTPAVSSVYRQASGRAQGSMKSSVLCIHIV